MPRRKTDKEFTEEVYSLVGSEYTFLEEYTRANDKLLIRHNECGGEFKVTPAHFLHDSSRCPICSGRKLHKRFKKTTEEFLEEVKQLTGNEYIFYGDYYNARTKMKIQHKKCGREYEITPTGFLGGSRCVSCHNKEISGEYTKTNKEFLKEIIKAVNDEYLFLEPYKKSNIPIKVRHNKCGHIYKVQPNSFLSGSRCGKCAQNNLLNNLRRTQQEFIEEVEELVGEEYIILGEYINSNTKVPMRHEVCGKDFDMRPSQFLNRGTRCPRCNESKGERKIRRILEPLNLKFETQYKIEECRNINPLPFDFAIFNDKNNLIGLIEYDGVQHFKSVDFFGGEKAFLRIQKNDEIKNKYCLRENIPLLRINYKEFDNLGKLTLFFINDIHEEMEVSPV